MIGPMILGGTVSKASRFATSQSTLCFRFISRAHSIFDNIEAKVGFYQMENAVLTIFVGRVAF